MGSSVASLGGVLPTMPRNQTPPRQLSVGIPSQARRRRKGKQRRRWRRRSVGTLAETVWPQVKAGDKVQPDNTGLEKLDPKAVLRATRNAGAQPKHSKRPTAARPAVEAAVTATADQSAAEKAEAWADQLPQEVCNPKQKEFCKVVARRVAAELAMEPQDVGKDEPLRWVLHGGPGTGKSYALNLIKVCLNTPWVGSKVWNTKL